jgi:hypothetical protein
MTVTARVWCKCKHFLWMGDDRPADEDVLISCRECHPAKLCPVCGHLGADQQQVIERTTGRKARPLPKHDPAQARLL